MWPVKKLISLALKEDIGTGDITTDAVIPPKKNCRAKLIAKQAGVLSGTSWFQGVFHSLDKKIIFQWNKKDGSLLEKGETICFLQGNARNILKGERTALNLLQHLSGIATKTHQAASILKCGTIQILDTRKTLPLLRKFEKEAVLNGGGTNHRFGLFDLFLIKENHIAVAGSLALAVNQCKKSHPEIKIEVETRNLDEVHEAIQSQADIIMLDNMDNATLLKAAGLIRSRSAQKIEASGNMNLERLEQIKNYPIDFISMGSLIHSAPAFDFSLLIEWEVSEP